MRIGMSLTTGYNIDRDPAEIMNNLDEQVQLMAQLGFDSLSFGDSHLSRNQYIQVLPAISRMSAYSGEMQLLPLFLLPFYNPILLAEQIATLDVMTGGRTRVICGLGNQPELHAAFQSPLNVRVSRFVETVEIMRLLWSRDDVTYSGRHYNIEAGISINPKPLNQSVPIWSAVGADPAIRRAAQLADAWVIGPGWTPGFIEDKLRFYRDALDEYGRRNEVSEVVLRRDAHLALTSVAAHREAQRLFERGYRGFGPKELEEALIVGGPDECIKYLESMAELGINHVLFRCALDQREEALQTIRVLGTEVIPHFR